MYSFISYYHKNCSEFLKFFQIFLTYQKRYDIITRELHIIMTEERSATAVGQGSQPFEVDREGGAPKSYLCGVVWAGSLG